MESVDEFAYLLRTSALFIERAIADGIRLRDADGMWVIPDADAPSKFREIADLLQEKE